MKRKNRNTADLLLENGSSSQCVCGSRAIKQVEEDWDLSEGQEAENILGYWGTLECLKCGHRWIFEDDLPSDFDESLEAWKNQERGLLAVESGRAVDKAFRKWALDNNHLYLRCTHLVQFLTGRPFKGPILKVFKNVPKRFITAFRRFMKIRGVAPYGNVKGMADFILMKGNAKKVMIFVECKASGKLKPHQKRAAAYFEKYRYATNVWRGKDTGGLFKE
jgi:hypothetical protein